MTLKLDRMADLIDQFQALHAGRRDRRLARMAAFLAEFDAKQQTLPPRPAAFNLLSLFKVETDEVRHSRFLAWLLAERAEHGQGNGFLRSLVECCQLGLDEADLHRYRVRKEHTEFEATIDLMIYRRGTFLIYLENKIFAAEGLRQIDREYRDMNRIGEVLRIPQERRFAIFLTPDGRRPVSGDAQPWHTLSYGRLAQAFEAVSPQLTDPKLEIILQDWLETVRTFGGFDANIE